MIAINQLDELLTPRSIEEVIRVAALTRFAARRIKHQEMLQEEAVHRIRIERTKQAHDEEVWVHQLKVYLTGYQTVLSAAEARTTALISLDYEVDEDGLFFFCPRFTPMDGRTGMMRLVKPDLLQKYFQHHLDTSVEGGHQGFGRTYQRIRACFHEIVRYKSVQRYIWYSTDFETGKGVSKCVHAIA